MPIASTSVTLKQLRYFTRVVELGSISRAAADLNVAQTAVGLQVRALEDCLDSSLLLRHAKGVVATEDGRLVFERSRGILSAVEALATEVRERKQRRPHEIWLGLAPNIMAAIGTRALIEQDSRVPDFRLHLIEGTRNELLDDLASGELDWAILHEADDVPGCHSVPILRQSVWLVCRPGLIASRGSVTMKEALRQDLALDSGKRVIAGAVERAAGRLGLSPNIRYEVDSVSAIKKLISGEDVCGLLNRALVSDELERGELEAHRIVEPEFRITAYFVTRNEHVPTERDVPLLTFIDDLLDAYCAARATDELRLGRLSSIVQGTMAARRIA